MTDKQIINGLKYEKLSEDELNDLSQWELVDIIFAYREDLKCKEQECEEWKNKLAKSFADERKKEIVIDLLKEENEKLKNVLQEIKEMCKQKLPVGLSAPSCYESFEAFTGYILQKCEVIDE